MDFIRPVFSDKNVAVRKCYLNTQGMVLCHDKEFKKMLTVDEAVDAYLKGVVIYDPLDDIYYTPIRCRILEHGGLNDSGLAKLLCIKENDTTNTSADIFEVSSAKLL